MSAIASRVVIVTGAASGLGKATAMRLVKSGAKVALVDLPTQPGAALAASLGANAMFTPADVTKEDEVRAVRVVRLSLLQRWHWRGVRLQALRACVCAVDAADCSRN